MSFTKLTRYLLYAFPVTSLAISFIVILGWMTQNTTIIQVYPDMPPMVFNTALCFFFLSTGLIFMELRPSWVRKVCGSVVFVISSLTLLNYFDGFDSGVDTFFYQPFYALGSVAPGRMAVSTASCFVLMSLSLIFVEKRFWPQLLSTAFGTTVFGFSVVALLGFFLHLNSEYGWGSFSRMAIHTAVCFILLSATLVFLVRRGVRENYGHPRVYLPFYVLVSGTLLTILMWELLVIQDIHRSRGVNQIRAEGVKTLLDNSFYPLEKALQHMSKRFASGRYPDFNSWEVDAESYFQDFAGLKRLMWAEKDHVFRWVFPSTVESRRQIGLNMKLNSTLYEAVSRVTNDHQVRMTKSFEVSPGERAFVLIVPIIKGGQLQGTLSAVIMISSFLGSISNLEGYDISLIENGVRIFSQGQTDIVFARDWTIRPLYRGFDTNWEIQLTPSLATVRENSSILPTVVLVFGISFSLLLGLALRFYRRARESELEAQNALQWQKASMDAMPLFIISVSVDGRVREMNVEASRFLEFNLEDLVFNKSTADIFFMPQELRVKADDLSLVLDREIHPNFECLVALLETKEATASEWTLVSRTGKRIPSVLSISPIQSSFMDHSGFLLVFEDVTLKKEREHKIYEQEAKILASSRLASLGEMAAGIAHEINNPLAIINGHAGVMRKVLEQSSHAERADQDQALLKKVNAIENTVQRIAKIIRGMHYYARDSSSESLEEFSVESLVDDTLTFCQEKIKNEGIELSVNVPKGLFVRGRSTQVSQVLLNLLNNACDAIASSKNKEIAIQARRYDTGIEVSVTDSGPGVPVQLRSKVMEPFFTTKEVGKGIGLGLSISSGILQSLGGKLYLDEKSIQTRFVIWLPTVT